MTDEQLRLILHDVRARLGPDAPAWTDGNDSDPGVTLVQVFGWLAESLLARERARPEVRTAAAKIGERLTRLGRAGRSIAGEPLTRLHYFQGRLLTAEDLLIEQEYVRGRLRRHNRLCTGFGIVEGLDVEVGEDDDALVVIVNPGFAIDPDGEEIILCDRRALPIAPAGDRVFVMLRATDRPAAAIALVDSVEVTGHARLVEDASISIAADPHASGLAIARLVPDGSRIRVDAQFTPRRITAAAARERS